MTVNDEALTDRQREILDYIVRQQAERGYPPSVREIGEAVGLTSPSTVHSHLATLQRRGYLRRDPTKPRAIEVTYDPASGASIERRPVSHIPLIGDVAAGTDVLAAENVEELVPVPADPASILTISREWALVERFRRQVTPCGTRTCSRTVGR